MSQIQSMDGEVNSLPPNYEVMLTRRSNFPPTELYRFTQPTSSTEEMMSRVFGQILEMHRKEVQELQRENQALNTQLQDSKYESVKNQLSDLTIAYNALETKHKNMEADNMKLMDSLRLVRTQNAKLEKLKQSLVHSLQSANIPQPGGFQYNFDSKVKFINKSSSHKTLGEVRKFSRTKEDHLSRADLLISQIDQALESSNLSMNRDLSHSPIPAKPFNPYNYTSRQLSQPRATIQQPQFYSPKGSSSQKENYGEIDLTLKPSCGSAKIERII